MAGLIENESELEKLIRSMKTVAVVGMKNESDPDKPAYQIPKAVQARGIRVIPVNPTIKSSLGETAYSSLAQVPETFDTVNVFRRSEVVEALAEEIRGLPMPQP